jgi:glycosyltransferase involved in cell wall biosynthesis
MKPRHVLLIASEEFVPQHSPLSGVFERDQALALVDRGIRVGVLSVHDTFPVWPRTKLFLRRLLVPGSPTASSTLRQSFISVVSTRIAVRNEFGLFVCRGAVGALRLRDAVRRQEKWERVAARAFDVYCEFAGEPDVIHAHNVRPGGMFASSISDRTGVPFVITEHSSAFSRGDVPDEQREAIRSAYARASARVVVSPALGELLRKQAYLDDYAAIPNIIDSCIAALPPTPPPHNVRFLSVGSFDDNKGQSVLVDAFARAFVGNENAAELVLVGAGPSHKDVARKINALGLESRVQLRGQIARSEVGRELMASSALVIASKHETFGAVAIEALACGRPVISTRCGGPESIVGAAEGMFVERSVDGIAEGLRNFIARRAQFPSATLRENALSRFGPTEIANQLELVYDEAMSSRGSS